MQVDSIQPMNMSFPYKPIKDKEVVPDSSLPHMPPDTFEKNKEPYDPVKEYEKARLEKEQQFKQQISTKGKFSKKNSNISWKGDKNENS